MSPSWAAAAALTFAASIHCVGMCGGFVLALSGPDPRRRLRRLVDQLALQAGKATSYAFLGALAGGVGAAFVSSTAVSWAGRALALLAGLAIAAAGLTLLGLRARVASDWFAARIAPLWSHWLGPIVSQRPAGASVVIGMAMGFLPCPLVYAGLAAAVATGSAAGGAATLAGVALGTVPALTLVALFGSALPLGARRGLARAGGVLLLAVGLVTAWRGVGGHEHHGHAAALPSGATHEPVRHEGHVMPAGAPGVHQHGAPAPTVAPTTAPEHAHHN